MAKPNIKRPADLTRRLINLRAAEEARKMAEQLSGEPTPHEVDLCVACLGCGAGPGKECSSLDRGIVHFGRRLRRMMFGLRAPSETPAVSG